MPITARPFSMFGGRAEEAMNFYVSILPDTKILDITRYGSGGPGAEGTVMRASFAVGDQTVLCFDSPVHHAFTFTPAFSLFVEYPSEAELRRIFAALSSDGQILMPLANYGFSREFGWLNDRFGVSWQLNLK